MAITDTYARVPCADIVIDRANRQRKIIDTKGLKDSIARRGVMQPIIVTRDLLLMAGERRLTASLELGLPDIPCRFFEDLSPTETMIVELEENLKRSDLTWQDTAAAIAQLHSIYVASDSTWTHGKTGEAVGIDASYIGRFLRVAQDLSNPAIARQTALETAYNMLKRADERRSADALSEIMSASHEVVIPAESQTGEALPEGAELPLAIPPLAKALPTVAEVAAGEAVPILNQAFGEWAESYSGLPFNFLHCDFPYGINVFDGEYGDNTGTEGYSDTKDVYFDLIEALARHQDKLISHSAHIMFWFSMEHYIATFDAFDSLFPDIVWQKFPLLWMKSDNVGIMPDPKRGPRRIYETCLIGTRGDRPVVKPVANAYACPTDKRFHPSTKPEPMLRHFFQMFVDNGTRMLDPTCGSASALRAAVTMGAESVLGLEMDPSYHETATKAFETFMKMRKI